MPLGPNDGTAPPSATTLTSSSTTSSSSRSLAGRRHPVAADTEPSAAERAPKPRRSFGPPTRLLLALMALGALALLLLGNPLSRARRDRRDDAASSAAELGPGSDGGRPADGPDGTCLITRWQSIWRLRPDGSRSFIAYPTPGCVARAREVSDLSRFPKAVGGLEHLGRRPSAEACTRPCEASFASKAAADKAALASFRKPSATTTASSSAASVNGGQSSATSWLAPPSDTSMAWTPSVAPEGELLRARSSLEALRMVPLGGRTSHSFLLGVRALTGTVDVLTPTSLPTFSYTLPLVDRDVRLHWAGSGPVPKPLDRTAEGFHHLGDLTIRVRAAGSNGGYATHSTVSSGWRSHPERPAASSAPLVIEEGLAASTDATATLTPAHPSLRLRRSVSTEGAEAVVALTLINTGSVGIEVGGLGLSMPMNQMFSGRSLPQVARRCSFTEVYLGGDAGYVQVTRTTGEGPVLLVLPLRAGSGFEGWRPLKHEDRANYDWMHEMLYEVMIHTKAYAQAEWRGAEPWSRPTSAVIPPGGNLTYGVRLRLASDVEHVTPALLAAGVPVAIPLPGPTLHIDMTDVRLQLHLPPRLALRRTSTEPSGCVDLMASSDEFSRPASRNPSLLTLRMRPKLEGRCRLHLHYASAAGGADHARSAPELQLVHLLVLPAAPSLLQRWGDFSTRASWLPANVSDPWARSPAFMGSDADMEGGRGGALLEDARVFMGGLSDESGAAAALAMASKQLGLPVAREVHMLEEFVFGTLWAGAAGERKRFLQGSDYSVRLSMLYWSDEIERHPEAVQRATPSLYTTCHKCWATCSKKRDCCYWMHCWSEEHSLETWRAYNYPHVTAVYWALYRLGRHFSPPLTKRADWRWYLEQAARTAIAMWKFGGRGTSQWGLMVGSIFALVHRDLVREGMKELAAELDGVRERRMRKWLALEFPYGSEFPWDSTGHEEIHTWLMAHRQYSAANKTVQAVLAYSSVMPHWAYCGSARRYWDFTINGKTQWGNEREFHHYGSTLNAIAVLDSYRAYPDRAHLLQLGGCALLGHLSNIHPSGAASMAWHGDPGLLRRDGFSGDYGIGLYGYWRSASSYLTCMPPHGWVCVLCDLVVEGGGGGGSSGPSGGHSSGGCDEHARLSVTPRDALRRRAYLAALGLSLSVEGAAIAHVELTPSARRVLVSLEAHPTAPSAKATLFVEVERVEPPPPAPASAYAVRCITGPAAAATATEDLAGCVSSAAATGAVGGAVAEYIVELAPRGASRMVLLQA